MTDFKVLLLLLSLKPAKVLLCLNPEILEPNSDSLFQGDNGNGWMLANIANPSVIS